MIFNRSRQATSDHHGYRNISDFLGRRDLPALLLSAFMMLAIHGEKLIAQQGFTDPFQKTGFHEGDLYSTLGASSIDAVTGRLVYAIPLYKLPRNGKLPQSLALVYNSNSGDIVGTSIIRTGSDRYLAGYVPNLGSNVGQGWRLSVASLLLENGGRGLKFVDSSGAEHHLFHTNGCPVNACPALWTTTGGSLNPAVNEMQPGIFRSADGEFFRAVVTYSGTAADVNTVTLAEVTTADGVTYVFDEFHPVTNRNPLIASFERFTPRVGEVKLIHDADGNQITLNYDHGASGNEWYLRTIHDGIRDVTLTWDATAFTGLTLAELTQTPTGGGSSMISGCLEGGQPDTRSCRGLTPPSVCNALTRLWGDGRGRDIDPPEPATFSGSLLNSITLSYAGEPGKVLIHFRNQALCRSIVEDHLLETTLLPPFTSLVDRVELPKLPEAALFPKYEFHYLPDGLLWKVINPLGATEQFSWRAYEPLHWDAMTDACQPLDAPVSLVDTINTDTCSYGCLNTTPETTSGQPPPEPTFACWNSCLAGGGGSGGYSGGGDYGGGTISCLAGASTEIFQCQQYKSIDGIHSCGPNPVYQPSASTYTDPQKDPNCLCERYVKDRATFNLTCQSLGGKFHSNARGIQDRYLFNGSQTYHWRYDRKLDDNYDKVNAITPRNFQDRRFVEITNPDSTRERLYFFESSSYMCSIAAEAQKMGRPSAREVLDKDGFVLMREDYEYFGAPIPGTARLIIGDPGFNPRAEWDIDQLHADFFRVATTTKYYRPHSKLSLLADYPGDPVLRQVSSTDDFRDFTWNSAAAPAGAAPSYLDSKGNLNVNLSAADAFVISAPNSINDNDALLYAHRSEQGEYLELGHFAKARECDAAEIVYRQKSWSAANPMKVDVVRYICAGDSLPATPDGMELKPGLPQNPKPLPSMGNDGRVARTLWDARKDPAANLDRSLWTLHQPRQSFLLAPGDGTAASEKIISASLSRFQTGSLVQSRAADITPGACALDRSRFPQPGVLDSSTQPALPSDLPVGACPSGSGRSPANDLIDRRNLGTNGPNQGNLIREEIATGAQANFSDNSAGTLASPFALNFTWSNGAPAASRFDGFGYDNQNRTINPQTGLVESARDANGKQVSYSYDNLMRVTSITPADNEAVSHISYPTMTDAVVTKGDTELRYHYDGLGRVWKTDKKMPAIGSNTDANGFVHRYAGYDFAGRQSFTGEWTRDDVYNPRQYLFECNQASVPADFVTRNSLAQYLTVGNTLSYPGTWTCFDALGRPERIIAADGATTQYLYLGVDSVVRVFANKDPGGHPAADSAKDQITKYYHDAFGRLIMVDTDCRLNWSDAAAVASLDCGGAAGQGADAVYFYDVAGRLIFVNLIPQLPANPRTAYIAAQANPTETALAASPFHLGQTRKFVYDSLGRLKSAANPENGRVDYLDYDALGNVLEVQDEKGRGSPDLRTASFFIPPSICTPDLILSPTLAPVLLASPATVACDPVQAYSCVPPGTPAVTFTWGSDGLANAKRKCAVPVYTATLTPPSGAATTVICTDALNPDGSILTPCASAAFNLPAGITGKYTFSLRVDVFDGTASQTIEFGVQPPPPAIAVTREVATAADGFVHGPEASLDWTSSNAPACITTGGVTACPYVTATIVPALPGIDPVVHLPLSGTLFFMNLFGKNRTYTVTLTLNAVNGSALTYVTRNFTVKRDGNYSLRYSYDRQGRLTGVNKFDMVSGVSVPLTEIGYDNYARLGGLYTVGSTPLPNAPNGNKTWTISHQRGIYSFIEATDYTEMGGRAAQQTLMVNDGINPLPRYSASTTYNNLGLPSSLTYPLFIGRSLTTNSVYTAGWLQGLSGNTPDSPTQRNYLTGLAFNPAGTLASFNLGSAASTAMTYDARNRPTGINNTAGATPFQSGLYQYDGAGNISNIGDQTFAYDRLNRLTDAHVTRTLASGFVLGAQDIHYTYDPFGNMTSKTSAASVLAPAGSVFLNDVNFGAPTLRDYTLAPPTTPAGTTPLPEFSITNRIKEAGYSYDANGNLLSDNKNCYYYDELNRMTGASLMPGAGGCPVALTAPLANYFYDADNLRVLKQLWPPTGTVPLKLITTVRGGLDTVADLTTHVSDGQESTRPFEQKNYVYGPGGLIASENRTFNAFGAPRWITFDGSTGCTASAAPATAQNLQPSGYDLALNFGSCLSPSVKTLTLAWNELKLDGTPKNCNQHQEGDIQDQDDENERQEFTNAGIAAHHCGIIHIDPVTGTALLQKLKYTKTYSFVLTAHADLGLYGTRDFVVKSFTVKLARNVAATSLVYTDTTPTPPPPSTIGAPGPGGRDVKYYQKDHLGTIRIVSDEAGNVLSTHDYEPFGLELPGVDFSDNTHRFTGHERDTETGLDYMKARYYGAGMAHFGSVDFVSTENKPNSYPQMFNMFSYARNNPLMYQDKDGNCSTPSGLNEHSSGICLEAFIASSRLGNSGMNQFAKGDNRGFSATDNSLTARVTVRYVFDRNTRTFHRAVEAGWSEVELSGKTLAEKGTASVAIGNRKDNSDGSVSFTLTIHAENGFIKYPAAPHDTIDLSVNFKIDKNGNVTILPDSKTKGYPSVGIYSYKKLDGTLEIKTLFEGKENKLEDLGGPMNVPIPPTNNTEQPEDRKGPNP